MRGFRPLVEAHMGAVHNRGHDLAFYCRVEAKFIGDHTLIRIRDVFVVGHRAA